MNPPDDHTSLRQPLRSVRRPQRRSHRTSPSGSERRDLHGAPARVPHHRDRVFELDTQCLSRDFRRLRTSDGSVDRHPTRRRRRSRATRRIRHGDQGQSLHDRRTHHLQFTDARELPITLRRDGDHSTPRGRRDPGRQDQHGRVRDGLLFGDLRLGSGAESTREGPRPRRIKRRKRFGGRGRARRRGARLGHRRVDPATRRLLRLRRIQTHVRADLALRAGCLRFQSRPDRPSGAKRS